MKKESLIELFNKRQAEMGNEIVRVVKERLKVDKVELSYHNYNNDISNRSYTLKIYINDYDYKIIDFNYISDFNVMNYYDLIRNLLSLQKYKLHRASAEEIFLHAILDESSQFHIFDGKLYAEYYQIAYLDNIVSIYKDETKLVIEFEKEKCIIDLETYTYYCEDIEEDEPTMEDIISHLMEHWITSYHPRKIDKQLCDEPFITIDKKHLQEQLENLNKHLKNSYYFIDKNDCICKYDSVADKKVHVCGLECIKEFGLSNFDNGETRFCIQLNSENIFEIGEIIYITLEK